MKEKNTKQSKKLPADKIIPLADRVLVKPLTGADLERKTSFGIIIPDTINKEKPEQGTVVAVGEGKLVDGRRESIRVKVGDRVVFTKYGYDDIKVDDEEFYIIKEENILAIIN